MAWWEMLDAGLARQAYEKIVSSELSIEEKGKITVLFYESRSKYIDLFVSCGNY